MATDPGERGSAGQTPTPLWHLTRFIGRQREIAELERRLDECRLLTLAGPGGCGKTRLALEVAMRYGRRLPNGALPIELARVADSTLVPQEIASALGLQEQPGQPWSRLLITHLKSKESLLVLDNCEHLVQPVAEAADQILRNCPHLRIVVTSREPLNLTGEVVWRVPGMSLPGPARPVSLEALRASDAVALFVDRARLSVPKFVFDKEAGQAIAEVCSRLDGTPLAIELAATLVRVLTVEQILERLEQRFELLTGGGRDVLPRHRTLRAAIDWSYGFLDEPERIAFRRLSVFAGSFGLDGAEAVLSPPAQTPTLDLLARLVDKSMILAEGGGRHVVRYRVLETLREYGKEEQAKAGDEDLVRRLHAQHFLELAETAEARLTGPEQAAWLARLQLDYDNLRIAFEWSRLAEPEFALRLAGALTRFWLMRGLWNEGRSWLMESLSHAEGDPRFRAKALLGAGTLAEEQGDYGVASRLLDQSAAEYRRHGDSVGMARALIEHGRVDYYQGDYELAQSHLEQGLVAGRGSNDRWTVALAQTELGHVAWRCGSYTEARDLAQKGLETFRELEDRWNVAYAVDYLGHVAHSLHEYSAARRDFEESLSIATEINDLWGIAHSHSNLGDVAIDERHFEVAQAHLVEAIERHHELGRPSAIVATLEGLASLAAGQSQLQRAITLESAATQLRDTFGFAWRRDLRTRVEGWLPGAREAIGPVAAARAERAGRALSLESAVAYALDGIKARPGPHSPAEPHGGEPALTRREVDIASLVARGLTSKQIAARLFISRRTAETHVDRILTKLHFRSRSQIAVWAAQRGLLPNTESDAG